MDFNSSYVHFSYKVGKQYSEYHTRFSGVCVIADNEGRTIKSPAWVIWYRNYLDHYEYSTKNAAGSTVTGTITPGSTIAVNPMGSGSNKSYPHVYIKVFYKDKYADDGATAVVSEKSFPITSSQSYNDLNGKTEKHYLVEESTLGGPLYFYVKYNK